MNTEKKMNTDKKIDAAVEKLCSKLGMDFLPFRDTDGTLNVADAGGMLENGFSTLVTEFASTENGLTAEVHLYYWDRVKRETLLIAHVEDVPEAKWEYVTKRVKAFGLAMYNDGMDNFEKVSSFNNFCLLFGGICLPL